MPYGSGPRHVIPIQKKTGLEFRFVGGKLNTEPSSSLTHRSKGTKWASCAIGYKAEPKEPEFGIVGMNSAGHPIYGAVEMEMMSFTSPCPLGAPPKLPKPKKTTAEPTPRLPESTIKKQEPI